MKKIKIMLLSLSVLAVVGGTVAFNVKGANKFCTALPAGGSCANVICPNFVTGKAGIAPDPFFCTTPTSGVVTRPCKDATQLTLPCGATSTRMFIDE